MMCLHSERKGMLCDALDKFLEMCVSILLKTDENCLGGSWG